MTRTWTGLHVLTTLLVVFGVVLGVNILFIVKAFTTFSGEDEQKPYLQGMEYNETLQRRALQTRLGWTGTVDMVRFERGAARIFVRLADRSGRPITDVALHALLKRPTNAGEDQDVVLTSHGAGTYEGVAGDVQPGVWDLSVAAQNSPRTPFEADRRVWLP